MIHMKLNTIGFYDLPWNEPHLQMETQKITPRISPQSPVGTCMNVGKTQWIFGTCICMYFPQSTNLGSISVREYAIQSLRKLAKDLQFILPVESCPVEQTRNWPVVLINNLRTYMCTCTLECYTCTCVHAWHINLYNLHVFKERTGEIMKVTPHLLTRVSSIRRWLSLLLPSFM